MSLSFKPSEIDRRFTKSEEAELQKWSMQSIVEKNHRRYPQDEDEVDPLPPTAERNVLTGGEGADGHPDRVDAAYAAGSNVTGYDDAPEDVREEIAPLTVDNLKAELDELIEKGVEDAVYEDTEKKAELRDRLARIWSRIPATED